MELADTHLGFRTEIGVDFGVTASFYTTDGSPLSSPPEMAGVGFTRHDDAVGFIGNGEVTVQCHLVGEYSPRIGFNISFRLTDANEGEATLQSSRNLVSGVDSVSVLAKQLVPLFCVEPITSLAGVRFALEAATDHPGGDIIIPDEDFRSGLSGAYVGFGETPRLLGSWAGLIQDSNDNGMVDPTDLMYPVYPVMEMQERLSYVAPLYGFGRYFIYVVDGNQYDWTPGDGYGAAPVLENIPVLQSLFRGPGRFEASIAVVGVGGNPYTYEVGPAEDVDDQPDAELLLFVAPLIKNF